MKSGTAGCGLNYAVRRSGSAAAYCALSIRCGTRDEDGFNEGIAHFTEHTIFKGTRSKSASVINGRLDRLGGELNAYTTKEDIVFHATVLKEDLCKAASLLMELATEATFPEAEIETERGVVTDEIISYRDSPADEIYDRFEESLFEGHPLGRSILGTEESVGGIGSEDLRRFTAERFVPSRMAFTVVADIDEARMEHAVLRLAEKYFGSGDRIFPAIGTTVYRRPEAKVFDRTEDKGNHEVNAVIGGTAPSLYEERERIAASLLCNIIGGPAANSMLNGILRERNGWVYAVECAYTQYADTGIAAITFGCDKPNLKRCLRSISRVLGGLVETPLSDRKLAAAKKQFLGQLAISSDNSETQCLSMGKSLLAFGKIATAEENRELLMSLSREELRCAAERIFSPERLSRLIYL